MIYDYFSENQISGNQIWILNQYDLELNQSNFCLKPGMVTMTPEMTNMDGLESSMMTQDSNQSLAG